MNGIVSYLGSIIGLHRYLPSSEHWFYFDLLQAYTQDNETIRMQFACCVLHFYHTVSGDWISYYLVISE